MAMKKVKNEKHKLLLRHLTIDDYDNIAALMEHVYGNLGGAWKQDQYASQITRFPQGQIAIEDNGQLVAAALSMIVDYARFGDVHTYAQIGSVANIYKGQAALICGRNYPANAINCL